MTLSIPMHATHPMTDRACPVCASTDAARVFAESTFDPSRLTAFAFASRKVPEYMHHRILECPTCGLLYSSPVPVLEELASSYRDAAFDSGEESAFAASTYGALLAEVTTDLPDRRGAVDIGCGDGAFLQQLLAHRFTGVVGIEPSAAPVAAADPRVKPLIRQGAFTGADFAPESVSLVTCFQTIEHLPDPLGVCRAASRILKPGGAMMLVAHNCRAVSAKLMGSRSPIFDIEHLQLFCRRSVRELLHRSGLVDLRVRPIWNQYPLHYWMRLAPLPGAIKQWARRSLAGHVPLAIPAGNMLAIGFKAA